MKLPFVSRERLEEAQSRVEKLETEKNEMFDRILLLSGQRPIFGEVPQAVAAPAPDLSDYKPIPGKPTLASITSQATRAAMKRAKEHGKPIPEELAEIDQRFFAQRKVQSAS